MSNQEIQNLLNEIEQLTQSEIPLADFYREVLGRITPPLGSAGTAVWTCAGDSVDLLCQNGPNGNWLGDEETNSEGHRTLLANVRQSGQPCMGQPESVGLALGNGHSQNYMLGICPIKVGSDVVALMESVQQVNGQPDHQQFIMRLLSVFANAVAGFHLIYLTVFLDVFFIWLGKENLRQIKLI